MIELDPSHKPTHYHVSYTIFTTMTHELKKRSHQFRVGYAQAKQHGLQCEILTNPSSSNYREKMGALVFLFESGVVDDFQFDRKSFTITAKKGPKTIFSYTPQNTEWRMRDEER